MKTIPVYLRNIDLRVDISVPDNDTDYVKTLAEIKEKLGSLGEGALVESLTKMFAATSIEAITIENHNHTTQVPAEVKGIDSQPEALPPYTIKSGVFAGKMLSMCDPSQLVAQLDFAPYTLSESDKDAIGILKRQVQKGLPKEVNEDVIEWQRTEPTDSPGYINEEDIPF